MALLPAIVLCVVLVGLARRELRTDPITRTLHDYRKGGHKWQDAQGKTAAAATNPHYMRCADPSSADPSSAHPSPADVFGEDETYRTLARDSRAPPPGLCRQPLPGPVGASDQPSAHTAKHPLPPRPRRFSQHQRATINVSTSELEVVVRALLFLSSLQG